MLLSWADSRLPQRRAVFEALRKGTLLFYYMLSGATAGAIRPGMRSATTVRSANSEAPEKAAEDDPGRARHELDCDVVIVGSGAGGGAAAGMLAAAGLDVIVIETGDYYDDEDFDGSELSALTQSTWARPGEPRPEHRAAGRLVPRRRHRRQLLDLVPHARRRPREWAATAYRRSRATSTPRASTPSASGSASIRSTTSPPRREQKLQEGCVKLGWHVDAMPRGVRKLRPGQGMRLLRPRLPGRRQAVGGQDVAERRRSAGPRLIVRTKVERVLVDGGAARGIVGRTGEGHPLTVRSRAVVAACGAIHTPALLKRSGLQNPNIGKHLKLHPATAVFGVFDEELKPWEGVMQALYSDQHRDLDDGYGLKYETAANHPHLFIPFSPGEARAEHFELMEASDTVPIGVLLRDRDGGEVRVGRDGEPIVRYTLSRFDAAICGPGSKARPRSSRRRARGGSSPRTRSGSPTTRAAGGSRERVHGRRRRRRLRPRPDHLGSFHIMGSARMGGSPATSACDPDRADLGGARPLRVRRLRVPDRVRRQPPDLDPGDRAHGRAGAGGSPAALARARSRAPVCLFSSATCGGILPQRGIRHLPIHLRR